MGWRWYQRFRLPFGINANLSKNGIGWSWGLGFIRWGVSPMGTKWISIGIPGTGFRYFKNVQYFPFENFIQRIKRNRKVNSYLKSESLEQSKRLSLNAKYKQKNPIKTGSDRQLKSRYPKLKKKN